MISFFNQFMSYIVLMLVIVVVAALGFTAGYFIRKALDKKKAAQNAGNTNE